MENEKKFESVYSTKVRAGKRRTYFFDVRQTKGEDYYVTITESTKRFDGNGYERHKIFLYKEDFNRFLSNLEGTINHVKTELMPDFDYELYEKRQEEWEAKMKAEAEAEASGQSETSTETTESTDASGGETADSTPESNDGPESSDTGVDEDISW